MAGLLPYFSISHPSAKKSCLALGLMILLLLLLRLLLLCVAPKTLPRLRNSIGMVLQIGDDWTLAVVRFFRVAGKVGGPKERGFMTHVPQVTVEDPESMHTAVETSSVQCTLTYTCAHSLLLLTP